MKTSSQTQATCECFVLCLSDWYAISAFGAIAAYLIHALGAA